MLKAFTEEIWTADGPPVDFHGFPYPVRMTVIRLAEGRLFLHSPIAPEPALVEAVAALGAPAFLVSPNRIHHLYLGDWRALFPAARLYASPGLKKKRPDLAFDAELGDAPPLEWAEEIDQTVFGGSPLMEEVVFFHRRSRTAIFADLIENFDPGWFTGWKGWIARRWGIVQPDGMAPLEWRLSFLFGKRAARRSLAKIRGWAPERLIVAHGACYERDGAKELERAFRWV